VSLPAGACDTHVHVFDPQRHPYQPERSYTPGEASVASLQAMLAGLGLQRVVLVQPSVYGSDNTCLMAVLRKLGACARGVAVVDDVGPGPASLAAMHAAGVRGIRLNIEVAGTDSPQALRERLRAITWLREQKGWHLQLHASAELTLSVLDELEQLDVPVVLDHYAGLHKRPPSSAPRWRVWQDFLRQGPGYIKLSAPYRCHPDWVGQPLADLGRAFAEAAPHKLLWGSDWPHTGGEAGRPRDPSRIEPFRDIDNSAVLQELKQTLGPVAWRCMLRDNPAQLYGLS
jgi:predicted TIM-barrel fold metal-dependent hydrolase